MNERMVNFDKYTSLIESTNLFILFFDPDRHQHRHSCVENQTKKEENRQMAKKTNLKLKDYLSEDGKLDLSILNLKAVPNINEIVRRFFLRISLFRPRFRCFSSPYVKSNRSIYQTIKSNLCPHVFRDRIHFAY